MQHILVTGGAGFIGSHTVDLLLAQQRKVTVYDNLASGHLDYLNLDHPRLKFIQGDILDYPALLAAMQEVDAVLHLAALPSVPKSIEAPVFSLQVNLQGFVHVLQAIRELARPIRLVYASSAAVYGADSLLPCSDEVPLPDRVLSPYALEKATDERYADLFAKLFNIQSLGLRYFNVYGSRQAPDSAYAGVIVKFIEQYKKGQPLTIFGTGENSRDFIHVSDVARANWMALQHSCQGVLNIATGVAETLNNLVCYIENAGAKPAQRHYAEMRAGDITHSYADIKKAQQSLQFHYAITLQQGIQLVYPTA